jgi:hypothetical protein
MAKTRAQIQKAYRERRRLAAPDAAVLPVSSLGKIIDFCEELGTLRAWDEADPKAIARAHELALDLALKLLGRISDDGNGR